MGCCYSKDGPTHQFFSGLFCHSRGAICEERSLPSWPQQSAPGGSFRSASGQGLLEPRVSEEQQRRSGPQILQQSPSRIDAASAQQAPQRASSQRTAEARSSHNPERFQHSEGVITELVNLRSLVVDFVDRCFSRSNDPLRSKARLAIYRLILENAERQQNSQSHEEIADAIVDQLKKLDCESFSSLNRQRTELLYICEGKTRIRDVLKRDAGFWRFKWCRGDKNLEFPDAERDEVEQDGLGIILVNP